MALGATAAKSLVGRSATVSRLRGSPIELGDGVWLYVTIHPSFLLRLRASGDSAGEEKRLEADLLAIKALAEKLGDPVNGALQRKAGEDANASRLTP